MYYNRNGVGGWRAVKRSVSLRSWGRWDGNYAWTASRIQGCTEKMGWFKWAIKLGGRGTTESSWGPVAAKEASTLCKTPVLACAMVQNKPLSRKGRAILKKGTTDPMPTLDCRKSGDSCNSTFCPTGQPLGYSKVFGALSFHTETRDQ